MCTISNSVSQAHTYNVRAIKSNTAHMVCAKKTKKPRDATWCDSIIQGGVGRCEGVPAHRSLQKKGRREREGWEARTSAVLGAPFVWVLPQPGPTEADKQGIISSLPSPGIGDQESRGLSQCTLSRCAASS